MKLLKKIDSDYLSILQVINNKLNIFGFLKIVRFFRNNTIVVRYVYGSLLSEIVIHFILD